MLFSFPCFLDDWHPSLKVQLWPEEPRLWPFTLHSPPDQRSWSINFTYPQKLACPAFVWCRIYGSEVHRLNILSRPFSCQKGRTNVPLLITAAKVCCPERRWEFMPQLPRGPRVTWGTSVAYERSELTFALARTIHNLTFVYRMTVW